MLHLMYPRYAPAYSLDRKLKMIFLKKLHRNKVFSASALKRWSFQKKTRTGI